MKISGSGRLSEGKINDELTVSGSARIDGSFECNDFRSSGSMRGTGNLTVHGDFKSSGSFRIMGSLYGDGNAKSSGSASVGGALLIKGALESSGSLRVGNKVEALQGIRCTGSSRVQGELTSQKTIEITGSTTIEGNVSGNDVFIGRERLLGRSVFKHPYKVYGNVFSKNNITLIGTLVQGDVKGRYVRIGKGTKILGKVYYVDNIEIHEKAILTHEPVQIRAEDL